MTSTSTPPEDALRPQWPRLLFRNDAPLQALHFDGLDQHGNFFHVVVAKARYLLGPRDARGLATLAPSPEAVALNDDDLPYDPEDTMGSVREESDLAPYKPLCDVLVSGHAHAPGGKPTPRFSARLVLREPNRPADLPPPPQGLSPQQAPSAQAMAAWRAEVQRLKAAPVAGAVRIDKTLHLHGPRYWTHASLLPAAARLLTLGAARPSPWQLSAAQPVQRCALRYELAFGGECRINAGDEAAARVPERHRLSPQAQAGHPDAKAPPPQQAVAHEASLSNPVGRGFARQWYLQARGLKRLAAHQIELAGQAVDAAAFWRVAGGGEPPLPAGFGPVGRPWQPRLRWVGMRPPSAEKIQAGLALNEDFDYRYWNCAPADQQCAHLRGGEFIELTNLLPPGHASASTDNAGQSVVTFEVPRRELVVLGVNTHDALSLHDPVIDTVLIDTDRGSVDICWRWCLGAPLKLAHGRLIEARERAQRERLDQLRRAIERGNAHSSEPTAQAA